MKSILYFMSLFFQAVSKIRHICYDLHLLKSYKSTIPVVSVGNIVAGGTGKTPFVYKLLKELSFSAGYVAILTRGYRSQKRKDPILVSEGFGPRVPPVLSGDEPYWLAQKTNASIWAFRNRVKSAELAAKQGAHLLILEDGFQHRRLKRNSDIVLLDGLDLFGKGYFLPRGYLRDPVSRLQRADWIIITRLDEVLCKDKVFEEVSFFTKAPIIGFGAKYTVQEGVKGAAVGAFCGIAKPDTFYKALQAEGLVVLATLSSADHCLPSLKDLQIFADTCKKEGAQYLICTEKDLVKLPLDIALSLPITSLKMDLECVWNEKSWKEMCQSIKDMV